MTDKDFKTKIKTFSNKELLEQMDFMTEGYYSDLVEVCLEELRCRLEATKWHYPSKGELPPNGGDYLVYIEYEDRGYIRVGQYFGETGWYTDLGEVYGYWTPIAWMPLPEPPKEEA